jgi:hypothetical protein
MKNIAVLSIVLVTMAATALCERKIGYFSIVPRGVNVLPVSPA